ncbi:uncharacterized protein CELE_B0496.11 [Caenorhabditis elegans]|uniref:Secreted protein n=1 Tax=Caenorhabditis elegans TaxID=6239 RepID=D1MN57_CAEEL|nr:Secreted protein [Caenorhabditis elegans]CCD62058.1 Secreted protein [Caenorhabditis elegans]|eukprot:NP_001255299.1 Uncharacterized protein CELE_B0496.11 [Caenorhabditis elegans]
MKSTVLSLLILLAMISIVWPEMTCAEQCAESYLDTMRQHPEYTSIQLKTTSLKCIQDCHDAMRK